MTKTETFNEAYDDMLQTTMKLQQWRAMVSITIITFIIKVKLLTLSKIVKEGIFYTRLIKSLNITLNTSITYIYYNNR